VERRSVSLWHAAFKGSKRSTQRELSCEKWASDYTRHVPSSRKRSLEVIRRWFKRVVAGEFIESLSSFALRATADKYGVDEFRDLWRRLSDYAKATSDKKVRYPLGSHDVFNGSSWNRVGIQFSRWGTTADVSAAIH
jgi:capsule polysaccharide modification protein KpsS